MMDDQGRGAAVRFGQMLARMRQSQRLSQNQLAQRAGLNHSYISRLESGDRGDPSRTVVEQFVGALGLDPEGRDADDLRMAAGFLPVDPAHLLTGETALAKISTLLEDPRLPDQSRNALRRILGLLADEYTNIASVFASASALQDRATSELASAKSLQESAETLWSSVLSLIWQYGSAESNAE